MDLSPLIGNVRRYGENLKRLRAARGLKQEQVARRMGLARQGNLPLYENGARVPEPETIRQHAAAIGCEPWELLAGVPTEYDRLRTQPPVTDAELDALLFWLAYLPAPKRRPVVEMFQAFLETLPTDAMQIRAQKRGPAIVATTKQIHRGKRRA